MSYANPLNHRESGRYHYTDCGRKPIVPCVSTTDRNCPTDGQTAFSCTLPKPSAVSPKNSNHLRLHIESEETAPLGLTPRLEWDRIQSAFAQVTGWSPVLTPSTKASCPRGVTPPQEIQLRRDSTADTIPQDHSALPLSSVVPLANIVGELWQQNGSLTKSLRASEAELATAIPVVSRASVRLADQLESILRGAAQLTSSVAAGLYLLDDATTELKLRSCWGMDPNRLSDPPRPLRHAIADLEALTGHAVVLEDTRLLPHWNPPLSYKSAACVPIQSASMSLGTLWVFRDCQADYSDHETHILEMVAEGMSAELERQVLLRETGKRRPTSDCAKSLWVPPEIDGWEIAASSVDPIPRGFCFWHARRDGKLVLAAGESVECPEHNGVLKLILRTVADLQHDPQQMLAHLNDCLWIEGGGSLFGSMFLGILNPRTGHWDYANLGHAFAVKCLEGAYESMGERTVYLGEQEGTIPPIGTVEVAQGDTVVILQPGERLAALDRQHSAVARVVSDNNHFRSQSLADELARLDCGGRRPTSVMVIRHAEHGSHPG